MSPSPFDVGILPGSILHRSCTDSHSHSEFMCTTGLLCSDNTVSLESATTSGSYNLPASSRTLPL